MIISIINTCIILAGESRAVVGTVNRGTTSKQHYKKLRNTSKLKENHLILPESCPAGRRPPDFPLHTCLSSPRFFQPSPSFIYKLPYLRHLPPGISQLGRWPWQQATNTSLITIIIYLPPPKTSTKEIEPQHPNYLKGYIEKPLILHSAPYRMMCDSSKLIYNM